MKKPRIVFAFVEAGMGHIMPLKSIMENFTYSDEFEIVQSNFFSETNNKKLNRLGEKIRNEVVIENNYPLYTFACCYGMKLGGIKLTSNFIMKFAWGRAYKEAIKHMEELEPDIIVSSHWVTNFYAEHLKKKPITIMYVPDVKIYELFAYKTDLTLCPMEAGYKEALKKYKKRFNEQNLKRVPFCIRNEALVQNEDKLECRKKLKLREDVFTVCLADGGCGIGKASKICKLCVEKDLKINLIVLCGKNEKLFNTISEIKSSKNAKILCVPFDNDVFKYFIASDLFCGKSGANMIAEPCYFGVPQIITRYVSTVEKDNCKYYVNDVKTALYITNPKKIVAKFEQFILYPERLTQLKINAEKLKDQYGSKKAAEEIYNFIKNHERNTKVK